MAIITWDGAGGFEGTPAGTDAMSVVDDRMVELKEQVSRRGEQGGHIYTSDPHTVSHGVGADSAKDGRHVVGAGGAGVSPDIYESDALTKLVTYADGSVTVKAGATLTADGITTGDDPGHRHTSTFAIPFSINSVGAEPSFVFENHVNSPITLLSAKLLARVAAEGTTTVQIIRLTSSHTKPWTDSGGDVFAAGDRPELLTTINRGVATTTFSIASLAFNETWRFEIDAVGSVPALDLVLILRVIRG